MTDVPPGPDRTTQMLDRLAEMDLAAAEHVHAQLLATTEPKAMAELARSYQRLSRCLRQSLALKAKLKREAAQDAAKSAQRRAEPRLIGDPDDELAHEWRIEQRFQVIQSGVGAVITAFCAERPDWLTELYDRFDKVLDGVMLDRFFLHRAEDEQVREICAKLQLPADLAARWRDLPSPAATPDPATRGAPAPWSDTG